MCRIGSTTLTLLQIYIASGTWQQIGQDVDGEAAGDKFGIRVAISADGTTIAAGGDENSANGEESGHVRVFRFDSDLAEWRQVGQDLDGVAAGDRFGFSRLKLSGDGTVLAAGALNYDGFGSNAGLLRVFKYDSTANEWQQIGQDLNGENPGTNDFFGYPVGLSLDGTIVASGGVNRDSNGGGSGGVVVFEYSPFTNLWTPIGQEISGSQSSEFFGRTVAMSADGTIVAGSGYDNRDDPVLPELVRVHRYDVTSNSWVQMGQDLDGVPGDRFGAAISLSSGGQILAVGSSRYGDNNVGQVNVYQFDPVANRWQDLGQALNGEASNDGYGWTVSLSADGDILSTGASGHDSGGNGSGRVYVYEFDRRLTNGCRVVNFWTEKLPLTALVFQWLSLLTGTHLYQEHWGITETERIPVMFACSSTSRPERQKALQNGDCVFNPA